MHAWLTYAGNIHTYLQQCTQMHTQLEYKQTRNTLLEGNNSAFKAAKGLVLYKCNTTSDQCCCWPDQRVYKTCRKLYG